MRIFLSWSGERSRAVARAMYEWLPTVIQSLRPWMSEKNIEAGSRWVYEVSKHLSDTSYAILCVTPENQAASWLMFEAGAVAKTLEDTFVCPYLVDMTPGQLKWPLAQFQAKVADERETRELVESINRALKEPLPDEQLLKQFKRVWPEFKEALDALPKPANGPPKKDKTPTDEMLEEILSLMRRMDRNMVNRSANANQIADILQQFAAQQNGIISLPYQTNQAPAVFAEALSKVIRPPDDGANKSDPPEDALKENGSLAPDRR